MFVTRVFNMCPAHCPVKRRVADGSLKRDRCVRKVTYRPIGLL